ncbi:MULTISPECIES: lipid-A-disaccharide synthase N-terminal domain-containing protein [unclassified Cetobacterium]|uniref:lipid-A-disaccharide synthase N-terminal domain-containing protein n=1 Tax=unclassified Cetobacterium TaxID=2630983 RepID=UPI0006469C33|nr:MULTISPECIES: lipid-A-disaccharide synthase N-terminal domain-containing protein [unclassified Cetobacterium]
MNINNWNIFLIIGFIGQGLFSMRFIIQWIASEKAKKSVIPFSFWIFSLLGSILLLIYALYKKDPVFILGQAPNVLIYSRNIYLIKKRGVE